MTAVAFIDDFGPVEAGALHHVASRETLDAMFHELRRTGREIIADLHTHPPAHNWLSPTDMAHPIEYRPGLLAIVIPGYALGEPDLAAVGVYTYQVGGGWRRMTPEEFSDLLAVEEK